MADETGDLPVDYSTDYTAVDGVVAGVFRTEANRGTNEADVTIRIKSVGINKNLARLLNVGIGLATDQRIFTAWTAGLDGATPQPHDFVKKGSTWYKIERVETRVAGVQFVLLCKEAKSIT